MLYFGFCPLLRSRSVATTFSFYSFYISPILSTNNFLKNQYNFVLCVFYSIPTIPLSKYLSSYSFMFWGFLKFLSMYLMATFLQYFPHLPLTFGGRGSGGVRGSSSSSAAKNHPMRVMLTRCRHIPHIAFTACWALVLSLSFLFPNGILSNIKKRFEFFLFQPLSKTSEIIYFANAFLVFLFSFS